MKAIFCTVALALIAWSLTPVHAASSYLPEPVRREIKAMSFAQCSDLIDTYKDAFGKPHIVIDAPTLRIVQFVVQDQTEEVACDGESNLVTMFEIGDR